MEQLLAIHLINVGDQIVFQFKKNKIQGTVGYGGHILNTLIKDSNGTEIRSLFTRTYPSLTAWSEACLREGLLEENTRYASWKRVIHMKTQRTLQSLRSQLNVNAKMASASRQDLYAEINRLHMENARLKTVQLQPRKDASVADSLLMTPDVIQFFKTWAATSSHNG
tara:strand:- start:1496 stop:1996 length:501 start_codon:yes stop_codon:yes gene_type:complete